MSDELRYHPTADQLALARSLDRPLDGLLSLSRLHVSPNENRETWSSLNALGVFGMSLAEADGGSGLGPIEEALIVMSLGRCLAAPSVLATICAAHAQTIGQAQITGSRPRLSNQRTAAGFHSNKRIVIVEDDAAELLLVRAEAGTVIYAMKDVVAQPLHGRLWFDGLRESQSRPDPVARFDHGGLLRLRLIDAAALSGIAEAALRMSVAFASVRKQFGRPIGMFQAVKHHCADMAVAACCARDQTSFAAVAVTNQRDDAVLQVNCAMLIAGQAALDNARMNIQIHGGIGCSDEAEPHLLLKRTQLLITLAGGLEAATTRIADA